MKLLVVYSYYKNDNPFPKFGNYILDSDYGPDSRAYNEMLYVNDTFPLTSLFDPDNEKDVSIISITKLEAV